MHNSFSVFQFWVWKKPTGCGGYCWLWRLLLAVAVGMSQFVWRSRKILIENLFFVFCLYGVLNSWDHVSVILSRNFLARCVMTGNGFEILKFDWCFCFFSEKKIRESKSGPQTCVRSAVKLSVYNIGIFQFQGRPFRIIKWAVFRHRCQSEHFYSLNKRKSTALPRADHFWAQNLEGRSSSSAALIEKIQPVGDRQNTRLSFSCRTNRHPIAFIKLFTRTDEVAEISGVLFVSYSKAPKCGKKCDEFKSLYRNILKLLFCGHISLLQRKTTPFEIPPHMGKRYAI